MNTARIVVLTIAVGAGGIAACPAAGFGNTLAPAHRAPADHRFLVAAEFSGLPTPFIQMSALASSGEIASAHAPALDGTSASGRDTEVTERTPL